MMSSNKNSACDSCSTCPQIPKLSWKHNWKLEICTANHYNKLPNLTTKSLRTCCWKITLLSDKPTIRCHILYSFFPFFSHFVDKKIQWRGLHWRNMHCKCIVEYARTFRTYAQQLNFWKIIFLDNKIIECCSGKYIEKGRRAISRERPRLSHMNAQTTDVNL
jgi:hypothetical protein